MTPLPHSRLPNARARILGYIDFRKAILQGELPQFTCLLGTMVQEAYNSHPAIGCMRAGCSPGTNGPPHWPMKSSVRRPPAMPTPAKPTYRHWLATLEKLVAAKGVATSETLHRYRDAWDHAADRTPHGSPIELKPEDFG